MAAQGARIPQIFILAATGPSQRCTKKSLTQARMDKYSKQLEQIEGMSCCFSTRFKFSYHIKQLHVAIKKFNNYLTKHAETQALRHQATSDNKHVEKGAWVVPARTEMRTLTKLTENEQLTVSRISAELEEADDYSFIQVDHLLLSKEEIEHHRSHNKRHGKKKAKQRRIEALFAMVHCIPVHGDMCINCFH